MGPLDEQVAFHLGDRSKCRQDELAGRRCEIEPAELEYVDRAAHLGQSANRSNETRIWPTGALP